MLDHKLIISELKGYGEMYIDVCSTFHSVFYSLEAERFIDPSNEIDAFVLHYVFLPKIQCALDGFLNACINHPIRTERNLSPKIL